MTAVGLKLCFARSSCANSASQTGKRSANTHKAGQTVSELCKLDLKFSFVGNGSARKDIKYQHSTVNNSCRSDIFDIPYLAGAELHIKYNQLCVKVFCGFRKLFYLALSEYRCTFYGRALLQDTAHYGRSCGFGKL